MARLKVNSKSSIFSEIKTVSDYRNHRGSVNLKMISNSKHDEEDNIPYESNAFSDDLPIDGDEIMFIKPHKKFDKDTKDNYKLEAKKR